VSRPSEAKRKRREKRRPERERRKREARYAYNAAVRAARDGVPLAKLPLGLDRMSLDEAMACVDPGNHHHGHLP
jgi:hypothetical protein